MNVKWHMGESLLGYYLDVLEVIQDVSYWVHSKMAGHHARLCRRFGIDLEEAPKA